MRALPLCLALLCSVTHAAPPAKGPEGIWLGWLDTGSTKLRIAFHLTRRPDGTLTATMDSPDQGARGVAVDGATYDAPMVRLSLTKLGVSFEGKLDGDTLAGSLIQGKPLPLVLKRVDRVEGPPKRPQDPKRPFPYREEEVTITVPEWPLRPVDVKPKNGIRLAGTLTLPTGRGPFPAVLLVTGSGPEDRDETVYDHRPFLVLSDALTRAGIATLRFDDRGTGKSEGTTRELTTLDFVEDTLRELEYLTRRPEIDKRVVGILGHSEGGIIAPIVATHSKAVRLVIMLAGTGMTGDKVLADQRELVSRVAGEPAAQAALDRKDFEALCAAVKTASTDAELDAAISVYVAADPTQPARREASGRSLRDPWLRSFLSLDPIPYLLRVKVPVLAIAGEKDLQVPPVNIPLIEAALRRGKNPDFTAKLLPGLNHLFQHAKTGSPNEYAAIEETFAPEALKLVTDWIVERAARARSLGPPP